MSNRQQRRQARRQSGRLQGETMAEAIQRKKRTMAACELAAHDQTLDIKAEIRVQRALWMCCVAMNRAFGIGPDRFRRFGTELQAVVDWYEDNKRKGRGDDVYANEMLRREASKCSGMEVNSLYDEEMMEAVAENYRPKTQGDAIRSLSDEELVPIILDAWRAAREAGQSLDTSKLWCRPDEFCKESVCSDEKIMTCILAWLKSPLPKKDDETNRM